MRLNLFLCLVVSFATLLLSPAIRAQQDMIDSGQAQSEGIISLADLRLGTIRTISKSGNIGLLPFYGEQNAVGSLVGVVDGAIKSIPLRFPVPIAEVTSACVNEQSSEIVFAQLSKDEHVIHLHHVDVRNGKHVRQFLGSVIEYAKQALFDCVGLIVWGTHKGADYIEYFPTTGSPLSGKPQWTHDLREFGEIGERVSLHQVYLGPRSIEIVASFGPKRKKSIMSIAKTTGHLIRRAGKEIQDADLQAIEGTAFGYVGISKKGIFSRSSTYLIIDESLAIRGQLNIDTLFPPAVSTPDRNTYLFVEPSKSKGRPTLMLLTAVLNGNVVRDDTFQSSISGAESVVFGTTILGYFSGVPLVLSAGTTLKKAEKGFLLEDKVIFFPLTVRTRH